MRDELQLKNIAARAVGFALASSQDRSYGLQILGIEPQFEPGVSSIPGLIKTGRYLQKNSFDEIVIGSVLARNLKVKVGDELTFLGSGLDNSFAAGVVQIVGIFESGIPDLDRNMAQISLDYFDDTFAMHGEGHSIAIRASHIDDVIDLQIRINALYDKQKNISVRHWDEITTWS